MMRKAKTDVKQKGSTNNPEIIREHNFHFFM